MARRDRPAEQGQDREMPRGDRNVDDEGKPGEQGGEVRGIGEDELEEEEDEFDEDETEEVDEDEEEGIR